MTQERPHRPAMAPDEAARELRAEAGAGRLDRSVVECVLEAAGHAVTFTMVAVDNDTAPGTYSGRVSRENSRRFPGKAFRTMA